QQPPRHTPVRRAGSDHGAVSFFVPFIDVPLTKLRDLDEHQQGLAWRSNRLILATRFGPLESDADLPDVIVKSLRREGQVLRLALPLHDPTQLVLPKAQRRAERDERGLDRID